MKLKNFDLNINFSVDINKLLDIIEKLIFSSKSNARNLTSDEWEPILDFDKLMDTHEEEFKKFTMLQFSDLLGQLNRLLLKNEGLTNKDLKYCKDYIKLDNRSKLIQLFINSYMTKEKMAKRNKDQLLFSDIFTDRNLKAFIMDDEESKNIIINFVYNYFKEKGIIKKDTLNWKRILETALLPSSIHDSSSLSNKFEKIFERHNNISEISVLIDYPYFNQTQMLYKGNCYSTGSYELTQYEENTNIFSFPFSYGFLPIYELSKIRRGNIKNCSPKSNKTTYEWEDETLYISEYSSLIYKRFMNTINELNGTISFINDLDGENADEKFEELFEFAYQNFITRCLKISKDNLKQSEYSYENNHLYARINEIKEREVRDHKVAVKYENSTETYYTQYDDSTIDYSSNYSMGFFRNFGLCSGYNIIKDINNDHNKDIKIPDSLFSIKESPYCSHDIDDQTLRTTAGMSCILHDYKKDLFIDCLKVYNLINNKKYLYDSNQSKGINPFMYLEKIRERILNEEPNILKSIIYYISMYNLICPYNLTDLNIIQFFFNEKFTENKIYKKLVLDARMKSSNELDNTIANFDISLRNLTSALKKGENNEIKRS